MVLSKTNTGSALVEVEPPHPPGQHSQQPLILQPPSSLGICWERLFQYKLPEEDADQLHGVLPFLSGTLWK